MNNASGTVVDQLRSVVEESGVFNQLTGAGVTEQWAWLAVHSGMLVLGAVALTATLRQVKLHFLREVEVGRGGSHLRSEVQIWKRVLWTVFLLLAVAASVLVVCDAVTLYQYYEYPRAMVLRDILNRI
jgi:hypothetical protein